MTHCKMYGAQREFSLNMCSLRLPMALRHSKQVHRKLYLERLVGIDAEVLEDLADEPEEVGPPVYCPVRAVVLADLERDRERSRAHVELAAVDDAEQLEQHREPRAYPHAVRLRNRRRPARRRVVASARTSRRASTSNLADGLLKHLHATTKHYYTLYISLEF